MRVNVVYSIVGQAWEVDLDCPEGTRVFEDVELAVAHEEFEGADLSGDKTYAVWNTVVKEDHVLQDGDRVETLREFIISPMERRRLYAQLNKFD